MKSTAAQRRREQDAQAAADVQRASLAMRGAALPPPAQGLPSAAPRVPVPAQFAAAAPTQPNAYGPAVQPGQAAV